MAFEAAVGALFAVFSKSTKLLPAYFYSSADILGSISKNVSLSSVGIFSLVALFAWFLVSSAWQWHRLHHFDGPFLAKISNLWLFLSVDSGRSYLDFWEVTQKYG